jgi:phosphatidylglycerol:prolipoprotein diacylglycerol transferase
MMPVVSLGPFEISSYALMLSLGAAVGFWLTYLESVRKRLDPGTMLAVATLAFLAGLVGARGLSWLTFPESRGSSSWSSIFAIWDRGGLSMYGGLALASLAGSVYARKASLAPWDVADTLAIAWTPLPFFVRIGCFLNGCCYGKPTAGPLGIIAGGAPNNVNFGIPSHPTQLYDAAAAFLLFLFLWRLRRRRRFVGQVAVAFLAFYPLFRFFHEFLRGDPRPAWQFGELGVLSLNQLLSLAIMAFAIAAGFRLERLRPAPAERPPLPS